MNTDRSEISSGEVAGAGGVAKRDLLTVRVDRSDDMTTLFLDGELDMAGYQTLERWLALAEDEKHPFLAIDLKKLTFVDCSGLHAFRQAAMRAETAGREFRLLNAGGAVRRVLSIILPDLLLNAASRAAKAPARQEAMLPEDRAQDLNADLEVIDAVLKRVVTLATETIFRADGASISLARGGKLSTVAATNDTVLAMDADQYELGEGPCFSASKDGERHHSSRLAEESRWPAFTPRAMNKGISSILSIPLSLKGAPVGALNLCSRTSRAFDGDREQATAALLARQASLFLRVHARRPITASGLKIEAATPEFEDVISAAKGVILAQKILEESSREHGAGEITIEESQYSDHPSADETMLREMVSQIPWTAAQG